MELLPFPFLIILLIASSLAVAYCCGRDERKWFWPVFGIAALIVLIFALVQLCLYVVFYAVFRNWQLGP